MPKDWWKPTLAEGIGVLFLVFIGAGSIIVDNATGGAVGLMGIALAHGLALSLAVSVTANVSGGHINPAVTLAFLATRRIAFKLAIAYIVSQLLFAVIAALLLWWLFPGEARAATSIGATAFNADMGLEQWQGMLIEAVLTFFLVTAIWGTAVNPKGPKQLVGFSIGLVITFDILAGGPLTGASMNPARTFGPALVDGFWTAHWIYWVGPILGGVVAALVHERVFIRGQKQ